LKLFKAAYFFIILFSLTIQSFPGIPNGSEKKIIKNFGKEYFVLNPEVRLIYESTFGETECNTRKEGSNFIQEFDGDDFKMVQELKLANDAMSIIRMDQELNILFITAHSINVTYSEPAKLVSIPVKEDVKSEWYGLEYVNDHHADTITITSEYKGNKVIKTEAGEFDCIILDYTITKKSGRINRYREWRAPNVGLVQLTAIVDPGGFVGLMTKILGIDEIYFRLKEIQS
jgi:hypothetical protein